MTARLRGHADARIDDKGRLKMPSVFKKHLEGTYGGTLFLTALTDDHVQIYPIQIWEEIEARVNSLGKMNPLKRKFLTRANRCGAEVDMDGQGRMLLKPNIRKLVGIESEVSIIGCTDHLELWPADVISKLEGQDALSSEDFESLGI